MKKKFALPCGGTLPLVPKRLPRQSLFGISCRQRGERLRDRDKSQSLRNSPLLGTSPLTAKPKLLEIADSVLNRLQKLTRRVSIYQNTARITADRGRGDLVFPTVHRLHEEFRFFKKKRFGILHSRDGLCAI